MSKETILLVDDEPDILELVSYNLEKGGYQVYKTESGNKAIEIAIKKRPDLIILDVMMPEIDGIETCIQMRAIPELENTLITFLSARGEDYSQIAGFDAGADDYITKPIKPRVLLSKVKAILRRKNENKQITKEIIFDGISVNKEKYIVTKNETEIAFPKKEFELLCLLMEKPDSVYTRETILKSIWGDEVVVGERTIDVHIRKLREKLGSEYIKTIKGVGYKFRN